MVAFGWLVLHNGVLAMDNLLKRREIMVNACAMCLVDEENVDHLLVNCRVAMTIWRSVMKRFNYSWVFPRSISQLFEAWKMTVGSWRGRIMWKLSFLPTLWAIGKERNIRCFEGKVASSYWNNLGY